MGDSIKKKAINFDLDTHKLEKYYPKKNPTQAYSDIKKFMENEGFTHRQWSGYVSNKPMSDSEINMKVTKLSVKMPWLKDCVNRFDVTDVGKQHDLTHLITGADKSKIAELSLSDKQEKAVPEQKQPCIMSLKAFKKAEHNIAEKQKSKPHKQKNKSHDIEK